MCNVSCAIDSVEHRLSPCYTEAVMKRKQTQTVEKLRRRFPEEWLLVQVDRFDPRTTTPLTGRLLAHSKLRDSLEQQAALRKGLIYLVYGSDTLPQGYATAF